MVSCIPNYVSCDRNLELSLSRMSRDSGGNSLLIILETEDQQPLGEKINYVSTNKSEEGLSCDSLQVNE